MSHLWEERKSISSHQLPDQSQGQSLVSLHNIWTWSKKKKIIKTWLSELHQTSNPNQDKVELLPQLDSIITISKNFLKPLCLNLWLLFRCLDPLFPVNNPGLYEIHQLGRKPNQLEDNYSCKTIPGRWRDHHTSLSRYSSHGVWHQESSSSCDTSEIDFVEYYIFFNYSGHLFFSGFFNYLNFLFWRIQSRMIVEQVCHKSQIEFVLSSYHVLKQLCVQLSSTTVYSTLAVTKALLSIFSACSNIISALSVRSFNVWCLVSLGYFT